MSGNQFDDMPPFDRVAHDARRRLEAAAPDLHKALEDLISAVERFDRTDDVLFGRELVKARAAIAKANGS